MSTEKYQKSDKYSYPGAIHIHTVFSDGEGTLEEITEAAEKAGLKWIVITDHDCIKASEGIVNGVYVIAGEEISPKNGNHYLAFDIKNEISPNDAPKENTEAVRAQGGFGFAAHPDESFSRQNAYKPLAWQDKSVTPDGIEIWNWFSQWADNFCEKNILKIIYAYIFKNKLVTKPCEKTLKWWDELNSKEEDKIIPAIGGCDAHGLKISKYLLPVVIFPYEFMFKTIINEVNLPEKLNEDFEKGKEQILDALKSGRNVVLNLQICDKIPDIYIENCKEKASAGGIIFLDSETYLVVQCCKKFMIRVLKDGREIRAEKTSQLRFKISETGKYRVEIEQRGFGVAYSNYIKVK